MLLAEKILVYLEPLFILIVLLAFSRGQYWKQLRATKAYFIFHFASVCVLSFLLTLPKLVRISETHIDYTYFYAYWGTYLISAVLIFFVLREVYSELMKPLPEIRRLGMMAFRWIMVISGVIGFVIAFSSALISSHSFASMLIYLSQLCVRSVSILELCLLAFIALTIKNLGRSFRSPLFGLALGFGMEAASEFVMTAVGQLRNAPVWSVPEFILQILTTLVLVTWVIYFLLPERQEEREIAIIPVQSPLIRWNDVAQALGHSTPRVAMGASSGFFLQDVERVVDRVLARNSQLDTANSSTKAG
jgi:hypothetical protein